MEGIYTIAIVLGALGCMLIVSALLRAWRCEGGAQEPRKRPPMPAGHSKCDVCPYRLGYMPEEGKRRDRNQSPTIYYSERGIEDVVYPEPRP